MNCSRIGFRVALSVIVLAGLACAAIDRVMDSDQPGLPLPMQLEAELGACNATHSLTTESSLTSDAVNEFGTRLCEYRLVITNDGEDDVIPVLLVHELDGYQDLDKQEWSPKGVLKPLTSAEWSGHVFTYTDPDASGPGALVAERIAGVLYTPECASMTTDDAMLELFSVELAAAPCGIDE